MTLEAVAQAENLIQGLGTSLADWQGSEVLAGVPVIDHRQLVPPGHRLVVIAPHPDDEVLACAGILAAMAGREADVLMIAVTDGEASHPGSLTWTASQLRRERPLESVRALSRLRLEVGAVEWLRLGLPDSGVPAFEGLLVERLLEVIRPGDRVLTTWRFDGHCDHEATGRAAARVALRHQACLIEMPVWAWHWAAPQDPRIPWARARKFMLGAEVLRMKRHAINAHLSQTCSDGQSPPVLERETLERLLQPFELVFL
ncbi:PIG-L deacetylase family protein [Pseudomonas sp. SDO55104_S430]